MRLGLARTVKLTLASFFLQTSWSFGSLQELGFLFNLMVGARKDQREGISTGYRGIFNTHPYMASYIIGATMRAYDDATMTTDEVKRFIDVSQTSFASAGDLLFWQTVRPALLLFAVVIGLKFGIVGPIASFIIYNILHLYHRIHGLQEGYAKGCDIIYILRARRFTTVQHIFEVVGAFLAGGLVTLVVLDFRSLLIIPIGLIFIGLIFKRIASVIIVVIAILVTMIILLV